MNSDFLLAAIWRMSTDTTVRSGVRMRVERRLTSSTGPKIALVFRESPT